ncbi:MAG TPA: hypothetical protein VJQ55_03430 [Candidatus Binatia bacterium]|nr:hypothetical protein [Candidatus Binatia bacterium]
MLEKISRIQSALGSITAPSGESQPAASLPAEVKPGAQTETNIYGGLLQNVRELRLEIEERLRPLAKQAVQAEVERLNERMNHEQLALSECLARIDENLLACVERIQKSQKKVTDLNMLKERLEELGAAPASLPEFSSSQDPADIITARLETLRRDGKL